MTQDRWKYHKTLAPEGRLVKAADPDPTGDGWVDTPAAFEEHYVAPDPDAVVDPPGTVTVGGRTKLLYPSHRYNAKGEVQEVKNAEEDGRLDKAVWRGSPADFTPEEAAPAVPTDAEIAKTTSAAEGRRAELYAATVPEIAARVATIGDRATLDLILSYEQTNPKGARKGVLQAVEARIAELPPPAAE